MIGKGSNAGTSLFLSITWVLLVAAIASGVVTIAFIVNYLRVKRNENFSVQICPILLLLLTGISFLLVGWRSINADQSSNVGSVIEMSLKQMPEMVKPL